MQAGTFKVTVVGAFLGESREKKTPYFGIEFGTENGESIDWLAYLTDNTKEKNLATLIDLGFKGSKLTDIADTSKSVHDLFDAPSDDINIVVEMEQYNKEDGSVGEKAVIKWVNVGYKSQVTKFEHKQAVATFKSFTFDGDLQRIRKNGPTKTEKKVKPEVNNTDFASSEIPF